MRLAVQLVLLVTITLSAYGQNTDWLTVTSPKVLSISTEVIKLGQEDAHQKTESGWRRAFNKAKYPSYFLGLSSLTGPSTMLFLTGYDSLAAWQKDDDGQGADPWLWAEQDKLSIEDAAFVSSKLHEYAELLPELSVPAKLPIAAVRCFSVTRIEVAPSRQREFKAWLRAQVATRSAMLPHLATYQVMAGGSISSFVLIEARTSRAAFDHDLLPFDTLVEGVHSVTRNLFAPEPTMSRLPPGFSKGNESFWSVPD